VFRKEVSRDIVAALKRAGVIAIGPRSPDLGAPYTYATTATFLSVFGLASLRDLEELEDAGLLTKADLLAGENRWGSVTGRRGPQWGFYR
jgi:segregation and condensation protein B